MNIKKSTLKHRKTITYIVFLFSGLGELCAQEIPIAAGGDAIGTGGTISYSVGQVVYTTNTGTSGSVSQGVQQPYKIMTVGIGETELNISLSVFPNPTVDNLTLQISGYNNEKLLYQLFDAHGKLLDNGSVTTQKTQINTASLPCATYFLNVVNQENKKVQSFKIIKN